ncbi:hypothetical protein HA052_15055 [Chromobacterium haemolyticum]|uniref:Lysis protein n=1 Tax=Chromobacterium fluminis TaxID=3044269 RepID=A0ABX0LAG4_9NEIS|nr:hypothetical protein [Chromobacterium haemolyticum]NHR06509.1 hypothetical protein [Chromobacterium haemolyticum]
MTPWLKPVGLALAIFAVSGLIAGGGYQIAANTYQARLERLQADYARERQSLAEAEAAALREQTELNEQAHRLGVELLNTRAELVAAHAALKRRIPDANRSDGPAFTGIGPAGLRLYADNLGYTDAGAEGLPATDPGNAAKTDAAAPAEAGLLPVDILAHSADYGAWCQQMEQQLDSLNRLYQVRGK